MVVTLGGVKVAVCYNNLWKLLIDKNMNKTELKEAAGISFNVMARMGKNETISFESIEKICTALNCLGIEKAGFDTIGLIEFDKAVSDTLKCNRPNWRVINDDIANISCLDLEKYFDKKKENLIYYQEELLANLFLMQVKDWD